MGSSSDGSTAAQSAPEVTKDEQSGKAARGILRRLITRFQPPDGRKADKAVAPALGTITATGSLPGLSNLRRLRVDDVAIPKVDIVAVPMDITKDELVAVFREHGFSRVVVFKGTLDHPLGLVLLKDLALLHGFGAAGRFSLKKLLRPVLFAPPSMPSSVLLQKMQRDRIHMALVIDEYGGVDGLVTIESMKFAGRIQPKPSKAMLRPSIHPSSRKPSLTVGRTPGKPLSQPIRRTRSADCARVVVGAISAPAVSAVFCMKFLLVSIFNPCFRWSINFFSSLCKGTEIFYQRISYKISFIFLWDGFQHLHIITTIGNII